MWTEFHDMHSGGGLKEEPYGHIFIQAPQEEAISIFFSRFKHSPERVSCTCCGDDYSISEHKTLSQATAFERNCTWDKKKKKYIEKSNTDRHYKGTLILLKEYLKKKEVLVIYSKDINRIEKKTDVPEQGYAWKD